MTLASEQLYKGYLKRNMPTIVSRVKVREIVPHLPCLTDHDRENIEAKRETYGNYDSMVLLLDCLKRRTSWPEQLIAALEACEHLTLAQEVQREYDTLRATMGSSPSSPSTTVVTAHIHPAPSKGNLPIPENSGDIPGSAVPAVTSVAQKTMPPLQDTLVKTIDIPGSKSAVAVSENSPHPEHAVKLPGPSAPLPSPDNPPSSHNLQQKKTSLHTIGGAAKFNNPETLSQINSTEADAVQGTQQSPCSPHSADDGSPDLLKTPEKFPVHDSAPPVDALEPKQTSKLADTQTPAEAADAEAADAEAADAEAADAEAAVEVGPPSVQLNTAAGDSSLFDKPGHLVSVHPETQDGATQDAPGSPAEPYSGNSERLEMSSISAYAIKTTQAASALSCLENCITTKNEPEENHYESPGPSLDIREDMVHVFEEPSLLNLNDQQPQMTNGKPFSEVASTMSVPITTKTVQSPPSQETHHQSEATAEAKAEIQPQLKMLQAEEQEPSNHIPSSNTKYIVTAAGVGACALLMAWKLKH